MSTSAAAGPEGPGQPGGRTLSTDAGPDAMLYHKGGGRLKFKNPSMLPGDPRHYQEVPLKPIEAVEVPVGLLRKLLASAQHGRNPRVAWSEERQRMDREAMAIRGEMLEEIETQLENLLLGT